MQDPSNCWEELEDFENMINEYDIEPDYFVDRAPQAVYRPAPKGRDKSSQVQDKTDPELFDFDLEVEPILQVLVGKSLEHARIEVIEEYEKQELDKAKAIYTRKREAALIQTQRLEASRQRRDDEYDRRVLQQRTQRYIAQEAEQVKLARAATQNFLKFLKREKVDELKAQGQLRS